MPLGPLSASSAFFLAALTLPLPADFPAAPIGAKEFLLLFHFARFSNPKVAVVFVRRDALPLDLIRPNTLSAPWRPEARADRLDHLAKTRRC